MAFDKPTRNRLSSFVSDARNLTAEEFTQQFQSLYGISDKGTITPLEQLGHLDDTGLATAALLRERIDYFIKTHPEDRGGSKAAVARLAREQAFTILNRLAAIRMAEKRGLIVESVGKGYQSKGFKVFEQVAGSGLGDTYHRYRRYIFSLFDELAVDLGVLFDRRSPQGLLFPRETALLALFDILNASDLHPLWAEDETIGWIYQYYNDPAERKKMRDESAAPRNSRELAVRNQFFTPRYVVEFLTDNTLGRIWYEMTKGKTRLADHCRYLVRRPTEIFLKPSETFPETPPQEGLGQEELLKQPVHIAHRPLKDPREIGLLDPACGSMHFGLYAFDLFEAIYEEAWDFGLESLRRNYPEKDAFLREIPRLIIEQNIHGIDIDPRAVQIAGLSLWLRAQKSWQSQHVPAAERPRIMRSNIVCAEPMPGNLEMLKEFTATLHPPLLGQMVEKVFAQMQLAGEAGSLLKIEEEIASLVKESKKIWQSHPKAEQMELSLGLGARPKQGDLSLDVSGISDERFWETAEERIYAALDAYSAQAESDGYQHRLFAEDAARGFAFIDICRKRYDVVVMNPPFGEALSTTLPYFEKQYRDWAKNLLCVAIIRAVDILEPEGLLGVIFDRTAAIKSSYEKFRTDILDERILLVADTGWNVLDANVETTVHVLSAQNQEDYSIFFDIREYEPDIKANELSRRVDNAKAGVVKQGVHVVKPKTFLRLPNAIVGYYFDKLLLNLFGQCRNLSESLLQARQGHALVSEEHFRLYWEVSNLADVGKDKDYSVLYNGAEFSLFASPKRDITKYGLDGCFVVSNESVVLRNPDYQFLSGVGYGKRGEIIDAHALCSGSIFTSEGQAITGIDVEDAKIALAFLNSSLAQYTINQYCGQHKHCGYVNLLPIPSLQDTVRKDVIQNTEEIIRVKQKWFAFDETTLNFIAVFAGLGKVDNGLNLQELLDAAANNIISDTMELRRRITNNDGYFEHAALLSPEESEQLHRYILRRPIDFAWSDMERDRTSESEITFLTKAIISNMIGMVFGRWDIRYATGECQPPELPDPFAPLPICPPGMLQNVEGLPAEPEDVPADYPLRISWPGILVDDENHPEDIVVRVRAVLEVIWKDRAEAIEHEACELLGVKTLRDYFRRPAGFFADHLKRYSKSRRQAPIYWPLSTAKGSYTLWVYYHRLTDQTLHTALADFIDPKLKTVHTEINSLRESGNHRSRLEELLDLEKELSDFHTEIENIIRLPWKPNLNDGVLITASPLWKLFRLPKWQKDLKACWEKLEKGEFDWAHLAYSIWPKHIEDVCKKDRSIAIAHGLEHLCEAPAPKAKGKKEVQNES